MYAYTTFGSNLPPLTCHSFPILFTFYSKLHMIILFYTHQLHVVLPRWAWLWNRLLKHGQCFKATHPWRKLILPPSAANNANSSSAKGGTSWVSPSFTLGFWLLGLVQVLCLKPQSLWAHVCSCTATARKYCFTIGDPSSGPFCPIFWDTLSALGIRSDVEISSRPKHSTASYSLHVDWLWCVDQHLLQREPSQMRPERGSNLWA